jgi:ketosteroid isomerase-like protein
MRRLVWNVFGVVVLSLLGGACQQAASLSEQDSAAIQKAHDEFARMVTAEKADPAGLVAMFYADDATAMPPNMPAAVGKDAIVAGFAAMGQAKTFKNGPLTITGSGDTAFVEATYEMSMAAPVTGEVISDKGKYLEVWKKQSDGAWKAVRDMWSSDAPAPGLFLPTAAIMADAGAELKALEWLAGRWMWQSEAKVASAFGPAGKASTAMDCRWFSGGQHLFCTVDGSTPGGVYHDLMVFTYDGEAKAYRGFDIDNTGMATQFGVSPGKAAWTFRYDLKAEGKPVKMRMTLADMTADGCTFRQEMAAGGGPFAVISEGTAKKLK